MAALQAVWGLRRQGLEVYATIDAGPNIKVLFNRCDEGAVLGVFPALTVIDPFGFSA
jgi:diphosphomevalonate decarboxylase